VLDRFLFSSVVYPTDYGFIPDTLSLDGDPLDVMVCVSEATFPGCTIDVKPIALFRMEDEKGIDEKIIAVPIDELHPFYKRVGSYRDLPEILVEQIGHFFQHYKDLEIGKWAKVLRWAEAGEAADLIRAGIERAKARRT
jgi:inorganic pyrophosphatase